MSRRYKKKSEQRQQLIKKTAEHLGIDLDIVDYVETQHFHAIKDVANTLGEHGTGFLPISKNPHMAVRLAAPYLFKVLNHHRREESRKKARKKILGIYKHNKRFREYCIKKNENIEQLQKDEEEETRQENNQSS